MPQFGGGKPSAGAFFDADFSTIDSLLAVSLLHGLQGKNDCRLVIVTVSRPNLAVTGFVDAVERFYRGSGGFGGPGPPIGMRTAGQAGETSPAFTVPLEKKKADGTPTYKNSITRVIDTGDPVALIRNYLEAQQDQNGFLVLAGPASNLAALVSYPNIKPLLTAKVRSLVIAGGSFPTGAPDPRFKADIPAAKKLFAEWPTPIVMAGLEVGNALEFPGESIERQFAEAVPDNPVADAYKAYKTMPYNAPSWAMSAALYAARPKEGYFKLSEPGKISVDDTGRTVFAAAEKGPHQYLIVDPAQRDKIMLAYIDLASAKPEPAGRRGRGPAVQDTPPPPIKK